MTPTVSVVIATYNRADKVPRVIESALSQTFSDREVIVVDDGSSDNTRQVLQEKFGDRIRYCAQSNQGASGARNRGIAEARGEWIAFLDSDDVWEKDKLEWQLKALGRFGPQCGACYTDTRFFNYDEKRTLFELANHNYRHCGEMGTNDEVLRLLVRPGGAGMVVCLSSVLARTDAVRRTGGFDPELPYSQDSEFLFRLAMLTGFCYVNRPLVNFDRSPVAERHVGVSAAWNKMDFFLADAQRRLEKEWALSEGMPNRVRKVIRQQLREVHSGWANWHLKTGDYAKARQAAWEAARADLSFNVALKWLLASISPRLGLRLVQRRERRRASYTTV